jgi:hypothetical protein
VITTNLSPMMKNSATLLICFCIQGRWKYSLSRGKVWAGHPALHRSHEVCSLCRIIFLRLRVKNLMWLRHRLL